MTRTARLRAFAKLNLGLRVLYKRPDGYHELRTVFQTISLADRLEISFTPARKTRIEITGTPEIPDNLVLQAAELALDAMRTHADIRFNLKKKIPAGAGLGGGSSDAAAVLLALPVLAGKRIPLDRLAALALQIGSDVPFFLYGGTALGLGRGEELYPLPELGPARALLVVPPIHSSTAEAYRDLSETLTLIPLQNKLFSFQRELWQGGLAVDGNDFEPVVFARHPELKRIGQRLAASGARHVAMSGSGSAVFGIFEESARLERAKKSFPGERVFATSFLSRAQYRAAFRRDLKPHIKNDKHITQEWPPQTPYAR